MKTRRGSSLVALMLWLATTTASAQQTAQSGVGRSLSATHVADALLPGDVIRLRIWREPDLSGDFTVDENGFATLPRLGAAQVTRDPVDTVKARLLRAYQGYVLETTIEVIPLRRIRVTGAVRNPGLYTVDPTMTAADAIALAGGATPQGRRDRVDLIRGTSSIEARLSPEVGPALPLRSGDQLVVPERRWISRNPGIVIGAVSATASMIWAISRLGR